MLIKISGVFNDCNIFFLRPQLLLIQALRPDRLQSAMVAFATQTLGGLINCGAWYSDEQSPPSNNDTILDFGPLVA